VVFWAGKEIGHNSSEGARWHTAYIGLGSNLGERGATLRAAIRELGSRCGIRVVKVSRFRESEPVGGPPQGPFLNAALRIETRLEPERLLEVMQQIEDAFGRTRSVRWGPRTLDLDLLLYEDRVINTPSLQVPHPLLHQRRFVLEPLCDLSPHLVHPVLGKSMGELLDALAPRQQSDGGPKGT